MEKDIGKINKNDTTDIVVRVDDFGGRKGVTIREFVTSDRYTGFTKSGVRIMASDFQDFKKMINSISEEDMKEESIEAKPQGSSEGPKKQDKNQEKLSEKSEGSDKMPDY